MRAGYSTTVRGARGPRSDRLSPLRRGKPPAGATFVGCPHTRSRSAPTWWPWCWRSSRLARIGRPGRRGRPRRRTTRRPPRGRVETPRRERSLKTPVRSVPSAPWARSTRHSPAEVAATGSSLAALTLVMACCSRRSGRARVARLPLTGCDPCLWGVGSQPSPSAERPIGGGPIGGGATRRQAPASAVDPAGVSSARSERELGRASRRPKTCSRPPTSLVVNP